MAIDQTSLFRARVKTIQMRQMSKAKKEEIHNDVEQCETKPTITQLQSANNEEKENIIPSKATSNYVIYSSKAKEIRNSLTELRDLVISRRKDYISGVGHCKGFALAASRGMSEWERNEMDEETERAIKQSSQLIKSFQRQIRSDSHLRANDEGAHLSEVARLLNSYLKKITKMITELRSVRVKRTAAMNKMTRLSTLVQIHEKSLQKAALERNDEDIRSESEDGIKKELDQRPFQSNSGLRRRRKSADKQQPAATKNKEEPSLIGSSGDGYKVTENQEDSNIKPEIEPLSEEETIQLVEENDRLYSRFEQTNSDVLRIEQQMSHIHHLQETFAEKVMDQERDIAFVNETAVHSVENLREGNEQIIKAIQNIASRRVILLFCIIVLTFTLLFLDWYNP